MSFSETIFLFFLALIIFGPKKLPEIARQIGKALNEFRRASNEFKAQIEQEISNLEVEEKKQAILPPSQSPAGTASRSLNPAPNEVAASDAGTQAAEPSSQAATLAALAEGTTAPHVVDGATEAIASSDPSSSDHSMSDHSTSDRPTSELSKSELPASDSVTSPTTQESHA